MTDVVETLSETNNIPLSHFGESIGMAGEVAQWYVVYRFTFLKQKM